jgi:D-alanyl-D-alanine carboxypeptidase
MFCGAASPTIFFFILIAVFRRPTDDITRQKEAKALLLYGFALNPITILAKQGQFELALDAHDPLDRQIDLVADATVALRLHKTDHVTATAVLEREGMLPVQAGDDFGEIRFTIGGKQVGSARLIAARSVEKATLRMIQKHWQEMIPAGMSMRDRLRSLS